MRHIKKASCFILCYWKIWRLESSIERKKMEVMADQTGFTPGMIKAHITISTEQGLFLNFRPIERKWI